VVLPYWGIWWLKGVEGHCFIWPYTLAGQTSQVQSVATQHSDQAWHWLVY